MNIKCIIIDDEENNVVNLTRLLQRYCPTVNIVGAAQSADDGKELIRVEKPDLVFLDIMMPGKNGFDLLKEIEFKTFEVIFVTAYDEYAIKAMKFSAIDYLLKPVDITELQEAVERAGSSLSRKGQQAKLENLISILSRDKQPKDYRIGLSTLKETHFISTKDIIKCVSSNNYTTFSLIGNKELLVCKPIYEYEQLLSPYGFIRCHQSYLINREHVKTWIKELGGYLIMSDSKEVPISKSKRDALKQFLSNQ